MIPNYKDLLNSEDINNLSVTLKENYKGIGLYATKDIAKGKLIAYYQIKVFKIKDYKSPTDNIYSFAVYRKNGQEYKTLVGDLYKDSFSSSVNGITSWAPFANEPSKGEKANAEIEIDIKQIFKCLERYYLVPGDVLVYYLYTKRKIVKGQEIMWYYGSGYARDYKVGKR